ncbi:MAG: hypothetical protein KF897_15735 [Opitutaceae bacterium]|nr:hypothetical protein [Opitutaceae bacterium]
MTTLLLLVGVSAIITHRFVGKYGSGVMTGRSAVIVGGFVTLTAVYFFVFAAFPEAKAFGFGRIR